MPPFWYSSNSQAVWQGLASYVFESSYNSMPRLEETLSNLKQGFSGGLAFLLSEVGQITKSGLDSGMDESNHTPESAHQSWTGCPDIKDYVCCKAFVLLLRVSCKPSWFRSPKIFTICHMMWEFPGQLHSFSYQENLRGLHVPSKQCPGKDILISEQKVLRAS